MSTSRRRKITSAIMLVFLGLALFAMVITGIGTDGMGGMGGLQSSGGAVVRVEDQQITETEVNDAVNRAYSDARRQQPELSLPAFLQGGTFEAILRQLVTGASVMAFGEEQGLKVAPRMVDREIVGIPAFRNFAGQFDEGAFRQALQAQNITEAQLRTDIGRQLMQQQLLLPIASGTRVPQGVALQFANLLLESRTGTIGVIPSEPLAAGINPTDAQVAAFYNANRARFTIPEQRVVRYAVLGREQVAAASQVSDQDVAAFYQQNQAQFAGRETRNLQQVVLPDQAAAQAFAARVRGGTAFTDAAAQAGFGAADIALADQTPQTFARETSQEVAQAAFGAAQGAVVGPVRSPLGFHVVRVEAINRTAAQTLQQAQAQIRTNLQQRKLADALGALVGRVEERINEGQNFQEIVQGERLEGKVSIPVMASGSSPQGIGVDPEIRPVLNSVFEIDAENPEPVVEQLAPNERFVLLALDRVISAAPPPLAQVQNEVRTALVRQQALARARAVADQVVAKINRGIDPAQALREANVRGGPPPQTTTLRRMDIANSQTQEVPAPLRLLFSLPERRARVLEAPNQAGWFIVYHARRTPGNAQAVPQLVETVRTQFTASGAEEIAQQFANAVQARQTVRRDEDALRRIRGRLEGSLQ